MKTGGLLVHLLLVLFYIVVCILMGEGVGGVFHENGWYACAFVVVGFVLCCCLYFVGGRCRWRLS